jgi:hypothetical protein
MNTEDHKPITIEEQNAPSGEPLENPNSPFGEPLESNIASIALGSSGSLGGVGADRNDSEEDSAAGNKPSKKPSSSGKENPTERRRIFVEINKRPFLEIGKKMILKTEDPEEIWKAIVSTLNDIDGVEYARIINDRLARKVLEAHDKNKSGSKNTSDLTVSHDD